jgi:hypothetical protein
VGAAEAVRIVEGGDKGRGGHRADVRHALQLPHPRVRPREGGDPVIRVGDLLRDLAHDSQQRGHLRAQLARQRQGEDAEQRQLEALSGGRCRFSEVWDPACSKAWDPRPGTLEPQAQRRAGDYARRPPLSSGKGTV